MEILCAYIRENAKASAAPDNEPREHSGYKSETPAGQTTRHRRVDHPQTKLRSWIASIPDPRIDIQTALEVIGRRSTDHIEIEEPREGRRYRLNMRNANLQKVNMSYSYFSDAKMQGTQLQGANLVAARMDRANLYQARLDGAFLNWATMDGADLARTRMEGATLNGAWIRGARMVEARMERAFLERAIFEGVDLSKADLRSSQWTGANVVAVAYAADFRDSRDLTQAQLNEMIGNVETLLPETLADGTVPSIPSCWAAPPPFFEIMIERLSSRDENRANELRAQFLCPEGTEPARTGTPLALDAPYPDGHPLAERDD